MNICRKAMLSSIGRVVTIYFSDLKKIIFHANNIHFKKRRSYSHYNFIAISYYRFEKPDGRIDKCPTILLHSISFIIVLT